MPAYVAAFLINLSLAMVASLVWFATAFFASRIAKRHSIVDVFWGLGFLLILLESLYSSYLQSRSAVPMWFHADSFDVRARWAVLVAVAAWSIRLSGYLALRQRGAGEDSRYVAMLATSKGNANWYALRNIYFTQALLAWLVSIPLQWVAFAPSFNRGVLAAGVLLIAVGVVFEGTGDAQLQKFLRDPANAATTMNRGLWRYTRHPNYFGDAVVWWGIYLAAASSGWGALTIVSALIMTGLLTSVSGKPLLERKLATTREGYAQYLATTSAFVPRRPKRPSAT